MQPLSATFMRILSFQSEKGGEFLSAAIDFFLRPMYHSAVAGMMELVDMRDLGAVPSVQDFQGVQLS